MHPRFQAAFSQLAENLQSARLRFWRMRISRPADGRSGHDANRQRAGRRRAGFRPAAPAAACARADLSHFNVGAIARGVSGTRYFGGNMEFLGATMQQTVHAEQSAISHAATRRKALRAITVNYTLAATAASL